MNPFSADRLNEAMEVTEQKAAAGLWDQEEWITWWDCGTGGCFAGNWALHRGCEPWWREGSHERSTGRIIDLTGNVDSVESWARDDLGLTFEESYPLFDSANTLDDLRRLVKEIIAERESGL